MGFKKHWFLTLSIIWASISSLLITSCSNITPTEELQEDNFLNNRFPQRIREQDNLIISYISYYNLEKLLKSISSIENENNITANEIKDPVNLTNFWNIIRSIDYNKDEDLLPELIFSNTYNSNSYLYINNINLTKSSKISFDILYKSTSSKESKVSISLSFSVRSDKEFFDVSFPSDKLNPELNTNDINFNTFVNNLNKFYNPDRVNNNLIYLFSTPSFVQYLESLVSKSTLKPNSQIFNLSNIINENIVIDKTSVDIVTRIGNQDKSFRDEEGKYNLEYFSENSESKIFYLKFKILFLKESSYLNLLELNSITSEKPFYSTDVEIEINVSLSNTTIDNKINNYISLMTDRASFVSSDDNKKAIIDFVKSDNFKKSIPSYFFSDYIPPDPKNLFPLRTIENYITLIEPEIYLLNSQTNEYDKKQPADINESILSPGNNFKIKYTLKNDNNNYLNSKESYVEMVGSNQEVQYNNIKYSLLNRFPQEENFNNSVMTSYFSYRTLYELSLKADMSKDLYKSIKSIESKNLLSYFLSYDMTGINLDIDGVNYREKEGVSDGFLNSSVNGINPIAFSKTNLEGIEMKLEVPEPLDTKNSKDFLESNKLNVTFGLSIGEKNFEINFPVYISNYSDDSSFYSSYRLYSSILKPILSKNEDKSNGAINRIKINQERWSKFVQAYNDVYDNSSADVSSEGIYTNKVLENMNSLFNTNHISSNNIPYGGIILNKPAKKLSFKPTYGDKYYNFNMTFITSDKKSQMNFNCSVEVTL